MQKADALQENFIQGILDNNKTAIHAISCHQLFDGEIDRLRKITWEINEDRYKDIEVYSRTYDYQIDEYEFAYKNQINSSEIVYTYKTEKEPTSFMVISVKRKLAGKECIQGVATDDPVLVHEYGEEFRNRYLGEGFDILDYYDPATDTKKEYNNYR